MLDERFWTHRYKSTSHAALVAALLMGGLFFYHLVRHGAIRHDLLVILLAMAITKLAFMFYYRRRE